MQNIAFKPNNRRLLDNQNQSITDRLQDAWKESLNVIQELFDHISSKTPFTTSDIQRAAEQFRIVRENIIAILKKLRENQKLQKDINTKRAALDHAIKQRFFSTQQVESLLQEQHSPSISVNITSLPNRHEKKITITYESCKEINTHCGECGKICHQKCDCSQHQSAQRPQFQSRCQKLVKGFCVSCNCPAKAHLTNNKIPTVLYGTEQQMRDTHQAKHQQDQSKDEEMKIALEISELQSLADRTSEQSKQLEEELLRSCFQLKSLIPGLNFLVEFPECSEYPYLAERISTM